MSDFNLDESVRNWKHSLRKHKQLEPGDVEELVNHLWESIDDLISKGSDEEAAFQKATSKIELGFDEALSEYSYSSAHHEPTSKWFSSWWIPALLPNALKITARNFKRQPGYSFINITGLAIGMACCIIIYLFVQDELNFDSFNTKADRIYRVDQTQIWADFDGYFSSTGPGVAPTLAADFPEIETTVRINNLVDMLVTIQNSSSDVRYFEEPRILASDSTFFNVFSFAFIEGNPSKALVNPYSIILTESTKSRYFDNNLALGKTITMGNPGEEVDYQVTGVIKDVPSNSHFTFDLLTTLSSNPMVKRRESTWVWTAFVTYLVLDENSDFDAFQQKLASKVPDYAEANIFPFFGSAAKDGKDYELLLTPISGIHLNVNESGNRIGVVSDLF